MVFLVAFMVIFGTLFPYYVYRLFIDLTGVVNGHLLADLTYLAVVLILVLLVIERVNKVAVPHLLLRWPRWVLVPVALIAAVAGALLSGTLMPQGFALDWPKMLILMSVTLFAFLFFIVGADTATSRMESSYGPNPVSSGIMGARVYAQAGVLVFYIAFCYSLPLGVGTALAVVITALLALAASRVGALNGQAVLFGAAIAILFLGGWLSSGTIPDVDFPVYEAPSYEVMGYGLVYPNVMVSPLVPEALGGMAVFFVIGAVAFRFHKAALVAGYDEREEDEEDEDEVPDLEDAVVATGSPEGGSTNE
jgi:hypothetical protein